jgi:hypothetical protein
MIAGRQAAREDAILDLRHDLLMGSKPLHRLPARF